MNIGENIRKIRLWKEISQKEISSVTRIPQGTLSKIEAGQDFLWSRLVTIAQALQVDVKDVVCFDSNRVTFNLSGERAKGVVVNQNMSQEQLHEIIQILKDENVFLRKMLDKTITKIPNKRT